MDGRPGDTSVLAGAIAALRDDQAHPYEGSDPPNAVRLVALLWFLSGILTLAFLPLEHPTAEIGAAGWLVAGAIGVLSVIGAVRLLRAQTPGFGTLLALSYAGLVQVAILVWLSGGAGSAYQLLYLFWVGSAMGIHPPRRALTFLGATAIAAAAPLVYDTASDAAVTDIVTAFLFWTVTGILMLTLFVTIRAQRVRLRADEMRERGLARADALTGLGNRRAFDEALDHELARSTRADSTVSVVLVDLDGLKGVNDEFGHVEGDRCLIEIGAAIQRAIRAGDRAFRWGGDEFAILLPDTDYDGSEEAAASICGEVLQTCSDARGRPLSVSAGFAEMRGGIEAEELVGLADVELMARKREKGELRGGAEARDGESTGSS